MDGHNMIGDAAKSAGACPFGGATPSPVADASRAGKCPFDATPETFDMFEGPYQIDPAEALRWSRDRQPVFFSEKLGYWVVSRYEDVKAVFRDNVTFSPSIALEKMTPNSAEANAVLKKYDYGMSRTLVNEDEPAHMERRRVLIDSFLPENLIHHEDMVRRVTRECVDRFIDSGETDLVKSMLFEAPLTVALHFLGVPEEDMDTLRKYSIAHVVNTWGRPTVDEQVAVAEAVGNFWKFSGEVLEKMRKDPSGNGWMEYSIRVQKEMPDVVTDSYLHSMMMAGIVASHETTAHASGNAFRLMLENRSAWEAICANPALIPNAVEECLRLSGSVVAWRRLALKPAVVGGVEIPEGAKVMVVQASANHDERFFENADVLDIYRENTTDHLTFGYGSHQCIGKNLARMEIRIFFEELTKRLPHMEIVPDQEFHYLPNTSFRGPDNLLVRWDPAKNPERANPDLLESRLPVKIGPPSKQDLTREMVVAGLERIGENVLGVTLKDPKGASLPHWSPGSHVDFEMGEYSRKYSLCSEPAADTLNIAILREDSGRGGSLYFHQSLKEGMTVRIRGPKNHFRLKEDAASYTLIAGGIGITPIIAMADRLKALGKPYRVHYAGRARANMALVERLLRDHGDVATLYCADEQRRLSLAEVIATLPPDGHVYACGPEEMLAELQTRMEAAPDRLHIEHFSAVGTGLNPDKETAFEVELADSERTLTVAAHETLLDALEAAGIDVQSDCREGLCGSCEVRLLEGEADHRDKVLTASERAEGGRLISCCSRARDGGRLVLAL